MTRSVGVRAAIALSFASAIAISACASLVGVDELAVGDCRGGACTDGAIDLPPDLPPDAETRDVAQDTSSSNCAPECTGSTQCCNSKCVDYATSNESCGTCGNACAATERCASGSCGLLPGGSGADGPLSVTGPTTVNAVQSGGLVATSGQRTVKVASTTGFSAGDLVLLHQTRGGSAGKYELATIELVDAAQKTLTLWRAVAGSYLTDATNARAQVVKVPQYTTVMVAAAGVLVAPPWNGDNGGILAFAASGTVDVAGSIDMSGRGFRGSSHAAGCAGGTRYFCTAANTANGFAGESPSGPARSGPAANGAGGGGGEDGQDCAAGGGGAYGAAGAAGVNGAGLVCRNGAQVGGSGGQPAGGTDLGAVLLFGGAGGEGGADEDGAYPGAGGNGGGIVWIRAGSITVTGRLASDGARGGDGVNIDAACGGAGCGMGPGGGGAGGAVLLRATKVTLGDGRVTALGNVGGACTCMNYGPGGTGGVGRIAVGGTATGTTTPAFVAQ